MENGNNGKLPLVRVHIVDQTLPSNTKPGPEEQISPICRTCLSSVTTFQSIFENNLDKMTMGVTSVKIYEGDGLPSQICSNCVVRINESFSFKQQVENCDYTLKQNYSCKESINIDKQMKNNSGDKCEEFAKIYVAENDSTEIIKCKIKQEIESVDCLMNTEEEEVTIKAEGIFVDNSSIVSSSTACSKEHDLDDIPSCDDSSSGNTCDENVTTPGSPSSDRLDVCTENRTIGTDKRKRKKRKKQICSICGKTLVSSTYLRIHMRLHTGERPFQCKFPDCDRNFISMGDLSRHTRSHSGNTIEKKHICSICGKRWSSPKDLKVHTRIHTGERPYKCEIPNCNRTFTSTSNLYTHTRSHTERKHVCSICEKKWTSAADLKVHMRIHTGERPYKCVIPNCIKSFKTASQLKKHSQSHPGNHQLSFTNRSKICSICGKTCRHPSDLEIHMRLHTGERPFKCKILNCNKSFTNNSNLNTHVRRIHSVEIPH